MGWPPQEFQQDRDGEIVKTSDLQGVILSLGV
jgi:hypothetical protein